MFVGAGIRRCRRSHVIAASAILLVILVVGLSLEFFPGGASSIGSVQQDDAHIGVTPFGQAFARGIEAMRLGDAHAAAAAFEQARAINPHIAEAHVNLGFAYIAMDRARDAVTTFEHALTINPRQTNAYYGLGTALEESGDRNGALGAMQSFIHLTDKDDPFRRKALSAIWEWEAAAKSNAGAKNERPAVAAKDPKPRDPPEPAPLPDVTQMRDALNAASGMISIVNVWASWCGPCRAELPSLQAFAAELDPARYRLVGLNVDGDRDLAREFIRDIGVTFANFWDNKGAFAREQFQVQSYPQTLFLDSSGSVLARITGAREWPAKAVEEKVAQILAEESQKENPK